MVKRILIIDDEEATLFSYKKLLGKTFVEVDTSGTAEDAIRLIQENSYDAVITDLRLSHSESSEGLDIFRYIRKHKPETPTILLTGYGSDEIREKILSLGAHAYIDKPVQISEIVNCLKALGIPVD